MIKTDIPNLMKIGPAVINVDKKGFDSYQKKLLVARKNQEERTA